MAASSTTLAVAFLVLVVAGANTASAGVTCSTVVSKMSPCLDYVRGKQGMVSSACCGGIKSLKRAASTTADRQTACKCLKKLAKEVDTGRAAGLPGRCGVSIPYPISTSVNCNSVR